MKKRKKLLLEFLEYLNKETTIDVLFETMSPAQKIFNDLNQKMKVNIVGIKNGTLGLAVFTCAEKCEKCNNCPNLIPGCEVLYHDSTFEDDADLVIAELKSKFPNMQFEKRLTTNN